MTEENKRCRECWYDVRHYVLNQTVQMGIHARQALVLINRGTNPEKILAHLDAITKKAEKIDEYFKNNKK